MRAFVGGAALMIGLLSPAIAHSIDCDAAQSEVEEMVCANLELRKTDIVLNAHYESALARGREEALRENQRRWLADVRDACASAACLERVYSDRIEFLAEWEFADPYCPPNDFPPYPNEWGQRINEDRFTVYPVPSGAVWVVSATPERNIKIRCLFSGQTTIKRRLPMRKYGAYHWENTTSTLGEPIELTDGSTVRWVSTATSRCPYPFTRYVGKLNAEGELIRGVMFLLPLDEPHERSIWPYCESAPPGKGGITQWVAEGYISSLTRLRDGTFLAASDNDFYSFIVRFDENLETQFEAPDLLIVDYEEIRSLPTGNMQERADAVRRFVIERTEEKC